MQELEYRPSPVITFVFLVSLAAAVAGCGSGKNAARPTTSPGQVTPLAQATRATTFSPGPSPTNGLARATSAPAARTSGADRDRIRTQNLTAIQQGLQQYHQKHQTYPNTKGGIQSLCVYTKLDQGCKLETVLSPLPSDPLGDAATNGYWYRSDGTTYTLFAQRESTVVPECGEHPDHFRDFRSVMCVLSANPPPGDVNCDGQATVIDTALILQLFANLISSLPCQSAGDVNHNGSVGPLDAGIILQYDAGLLPALPPTSTP